MVMANNMDNIQQWLGNFGLGDFTEIFTTGSGTISFDWIVPLAIIIIEMFILKQIAIPNYGLRFVPIYGTYYFLKSIIPHRKGMIIVSVLLDVVNFIMSVIAVVYIFIALFALLLDSDKGDSFMAGVGIAVIFIAVIISIVNLIIKIILNLDISEKFSFNRYLGILFALIPLVRAICLIVNSKKYVGNNYEEF